VEAESSGNDNSDLSEEDQPLASLLSKLKKSKNETDPSNSANGHVTETAADVVASGFADFDVTTRFDDIDVGNESDDDLLLTSAIQCLNDTSNMLSESDKNVVKSNNKNVMKNNDKNDVSLDDEDRPLAAVRSKPKPKSVQTKSKEINQSESSRNTKDQQQSTSGKIITVDNMLSSGEKHSSTSMSLFCF
jgi:hypothetical protein